MSNDRTSTLLAWCNDNGIIIDPRIQVVDNDVEPSSFPEGSRFGVEENSSDFGPLCRRGLNIYSRDQYIHSPCTLVYIPKTAILSVRSSFLSSQIEPVPYGHGAHLSLALALYGELLRGPESRWYGYLQSLPRETVDIAVFWGDSVANSTSNKDSGDASHATCNVCQGDTCASCKQIRDGRNAMAWLRVTEAIKELNDLMHDIHQYYADVVVPTLRAVSSPSQAKSASPIPSEEPGAKVDLGFKGMEMSLSGFCHAYSLVSSRAFWVDAFHGLSMVPIADVFNHVNENHVHMESNFDVCVECGSFVECKHDPDAEDKPVSCVPQSVASTPLEGGEVDYLEMRTIRSVPPHNEVFNTYGSLSNASLLTRYGFMLPENEFDVVKLVYEPLLSSVNALLRMMKLGSTAALINEGHTAVGRRVAAGSHFIRNAAGHINFLDGMHCGSLNDMESGTVSIDDGIANGDNRSSMPDPSSGGEALRGHSAPDESLEKRQRGLDAVERFIRVFSCLARAWRADAAWDERDDGFVYNPGTTRQITFKISDGGGELRLAHDLLVNADGKLTHLLWLFCIVVAVFFGLSTSDAGFLSLLGEVEAGNSDDLRAFDDLKQRLIRVQRHAEYLYRKHEEGLDEGGQENNGDSPPTGSYTLRTESSASHPNHDAHVTHMTALPNNAGRYVHAKHEDVSKSCLRTKIPPTYLSIETHSNDLSLRSSADIMDANWSMQTSSAASSALAIPFRKSVEGTGLQPESARGSTVTSTRNPELRFRGEERPNPRGLKDLLSAYADSSDTGDDSDDDHPGNCCASMEIADTPVEPEDSPSHRIHRNENPLMNRDKCGGEAAEDHHMALALARVVVHLCHSRYHPLMARGGQRGVGASAAELGDILDDTPTWMWRTRSALLLAMTERSVLESCAARWSTVLKEEEGERI